MKRAYIICLVFLFFFLTFPVFAENNESNSSYFSHIVIILSCLVGILFLSNIIIVKKCLRGKKTIHQINLELKETKTDKVKTDKILIEMEKIYNLVIENVHDGIVVVQDEKVRFINKHLLDISGYERDEIVNKKPFTSFVLPDDVDIIFSHYKEHLLSEKMDKPSSYSIRIVSKSGKILWILLNVIRISWNGKPATLNFLRDITSQKELEVQLLQSQKMEAIGTLAGGIAHDFNNLLQSVSGYTELLLLKKKEDDPDVKYLNNILFSSNSGRELIKQIMTFSRRVDSKLIPIDLSKEINQFRRLLRPTIPKMIDFKLKLKNNLIINADPSQIEQVLVNIALNAKDAMPDGGRINIETFKISVDRDYISENVLNIEPGEYALLKFSDNGSGMDKKTLGHIYEPFYTTKETGKGIGLGLSTVYGIIKNHQGFIFCNSELGAGTVFNIYIPLSEQKKVVSNDRKEENKNIIGGDELILLVDDEDDIRNMASQVFTKYGYSVVTASDGEHALEIFEKDRNKINLIILDIIMPGMGGIKCLKKLLEIKPDIKIIVSSGFTPEDSEIDTLKTGAKMAISKPYSIKIMMNAIRTVLDNN